MTYELAKQLKDAGLAQHKTKWDCPKSCFNGACSVSLSELIEACLPYVKDFGLSYFRPIGEKKYIWQADNNPTENDESTTWSDGKTPEEAVAGLWIELNKKD